MRKHASQPTAAPRLSINLMPQAIDPGPARPGCTAEEGLHRVAQDGPQLAQARTLRQASLESCCGHSAFNTKSRRRRMRALDQHEVEQAAAERIVARGSAHARIHGRGRARRGSSKHSAIDCAHSTARLSGGVNRKNLMAFLGGVIFFNLLPWSNHGLGPSSGTS